MAGYLINGTPSMLLNGKAPYEMIYTTSPSYNHIRVFGSLCYAHNQDRGGDKFESRSRRCIFVGYPNGKKGWKLYDSTTKTFFISRDVVFYEDQFPLADPVSPTLVNYGPSNESSWDVGDDPLRPTSRSHCYDRRSALGTGTSSQEAAHLPPRLCHSYRSHQQSILDLAHINSSSR